MQAAPEKTEVPSEAAIIGAVPNERPIKSVPLEAWHQAQGAKLVPFAGYRMPLQYAAGIVQEHLHTRASASLFDVSHMGQVRVRGAGALAAVENLVCGALQKLQPGQLRYSLLMHAEGGVRDDLILGPFTGSDDVWLVVNAACKESDIAYLRSALPASLHIEWLHDRALLALQGPAAASILAQLFSGVASMPFMSIRQMGDIIISRTGYTGEDGFEISLPQTQAEAFAQKITSLKAVQPAGLGARDSLRLEAGLCLYGHELSESITPLMANLGWTISKPRARAGAFVGAASVAQELTAGAERLRVGLRPEGRAPVRDGAVLQDAAGNDVGVVSSGGFSPSLNAPIAMGFVKKEFASVDTRILAILRGRQEPLRVCTLPFIPTRYYKGEA